MANNEDTSDTSISLIEQARCNAPDAWQKVFEIYAPLVLSWARRGGLREEDSPVSPDTWQRLGDYRLIREIGRGGMGVVYEAEQLSLGRRVALKLLPTSQLHAPHVAARFQREAAAAASLNHTNIVPVFESGRFENNTFY